MRRTACLSSLSGQLLFQRFGVSSLCSDSSPTAPHSGGANQMNTTRMYCDSQARVFTQRALDVEANAPARASQVAFPPRRCSLEHLRDSGASTWFRMHHLIGVPRSGFGSPVPQQSRKLRCPSTSWALRSSVLWQSEFVISLTSHLYFASGYGRCELPQ